MKYNYKLDLCVVYKAIRHNIGTYLALVENNEANGANESTMRKKKKDQKKKSLEKEWRRKNEETLKI